MNPSLTGADWNSGSGFVVDDAPALSVTNFTIEALIHRESSTDTATPWWRIAGQYSFESGFDSVNNRGWQFNVRDGEGTSRFGKMELTVSETPETGNSEGILSTIVLDPDKDYYVAASFDLSNQTDGVTFYAKNLTDGGPMQIDKLAHTRTALNDPNSWFWIGVGTSPWQHQGDGFVDEVRLSNVVLDPSELLVPDVNNGDFDGDDFVLWQRGGSPDPLSQADLAIWEANYGATPLSAAIAAVPEPAS